MSNNSEYSDWDVIKIVFTFVMLTALSTIRCMDDSNHQGHEQLGSLGHACFANKTCREQLKCLDAVGLDHPMCVKP